MKVNLTDHAVEQLKNIVWYISKVLLEPETAKRVSKRIEDEISSLDHMPYRYPLVTEEPWRTQGIRKTTVKNFIVYYWIDDDNSTVWVTAVVYGRRDQISALRNM
ncbi:MAG: type II toxin-antitoxin system RelE/ParE family toxin [Clostridia bacterium]|nr:type II toxin-antitoxin system RelE/ParE family toxin [Clostridia bacterium]